MRAILIIFTAVMLSVIMSDAKSEVVHTQCGEMSMQAKDIMYDRQNGRSMQELYESSVTREDTNRQQMIIDAYETPIMVTDRSKNIIVGKFRDAWYLRCVKSQKEN